MERIVLRASDGMILTDGSIFGRKIYLEVGRNPEDFYEITEEEYEKMIEEDSIYDDIEN